MSRSIFFICASPGTHGNFIGSMVRALMNQNGDEVSLNLHTFSQPAPQPLTAEFFFENIQLPETGHVIINCPFRPDFEKIHSRFPDAKVIVVTYKIDDIHKISRLHYKFYYENDYDAGSSEFFKKVMVEHPHLFSNVDARPEELTNQERAVFRNIIFHHKLLDGFFNVNIPLDDRILEVKYKDIFYNAAQTKQNLEQITGKTFSESTAQIYNDISSYHLGSHFIGELYP